MEEILALARGFVVKTGAAQPRLLPVPGAALLARQLPIEPAFAAAKVALPATQRLSLARNEAGRFAFSVEETA